MQFMVNDDVFKDVVINQDDHKKELHDAASAIKEYPVLKDIISLENFV